MSCGQGKRLIPCLPVYAALLPLLLDHSIPQMDSEDIARVAPVSFFGCAMTPVLPPRYNNAETCSAPSIHLRSDEACALCRQMIYSTRGAILRLMTRPLRRIVLDGLPSFSICQWRPWFPWSPLTVVLGEVRVSYVESPPVLMLFLFLVYPGNTLRMVAQAYCTSLLPHMTLLASRVFNTRLMSSYVSASSLMLTYCPSES